MNTIATTTVGELAATMPQTARIFEKFGIDYCCGGRRTLTDACASEGKDLNEILSAIESASAKANTDANYSSLGQAQLVNHIVTTHHAFTRAEIARLSKLIERVVAAHATRHPELLSVQNVFGNLADDLVPHMVREENVLFPYIAKIEASVAAGSSCPMPPFVTVQNPIRMMLFEHDLAGELLRELRRMTSDYTPPADGCISYKALYSALENFEQDIHQHIHLENNLLFPRAVEMEKSAS